MSTERFLVRVVRPVFQAAYIEVEGRDESDACSSAFHQAYNLPEDRWTGAYNEDDYGYDVHCVRTCETAEGFSLSLLDFPQYGILSTQDTPFIRTDGHQPWMEYLNPLTVSSIMSQWITQLTHTRSGFYDEAIENLEEALRQWKGTDQKVVPLVPPERVRYNIEYLQALLDLVRLLNEID